MSARDECLDLVYFSGCDDEGDVSPTLLFDLWAPIIEAEVRERIAQEIEEERVPNARNIGSDAEHLNDGLDLAARIARYGTP